MNARDKAMAEAVMATRLQAFELQRRHDRGDHSLCPDLWCEHRDLSAALTDHPRDTPTDDAQGGRADG